MHDQRIAAEKKQQIFAATIDPLDGASDEAPRQIAWNRPAQPAVVYLYGRHFLPLYVRSDAAARRFDLRKLGHGNRRAPVYGCADYTMMFAPRWALRPDIGQRRKRFSSVPLLKDTYPRAAILAAILAALGGAPAVLAQTAPPPVVVVPAPATELSADIMYRILVGDLALQRGEPELAARAS